MLPITKNIQQCTKQLELKARVGAHFLELIMRRLLLCYLLALGCVVFVRSHPKDDDFAEFEDDEEFETDVFDAGSEDGEHVYNEYLYADV